MFKELVLKNRSYRRFDNSSRLEHTDLEELISLARICPSSRNQQALKFRLISEIPDCDKVFDTLAWAGYLKEWGGPSPEERPSGYIIVLGDTRLGLKFDVDLGICSQTILLGAVELGLGGCMIASIKRDELRDFLGLDPAFEILLVIALGKPVEEVRIEEMVGENIRYWRDETGVHHVPKRALKDLIL
jgi:nitroreductase